MLELARGWPLHCWKWKRDLDRNRRLAREHPVKVWKAGRVAVTNSTLLDTSWVERTVEAVTPVGLDDFKVEFLLDHHHHGFAYPERRSARVWLAESAAGYPFGVGQAKRVPLESLEEACVFITAHELLHLWQAEHGKPIDARYPEIRLFCERDADAYAARMLRRYRCTSAVSP